ncbi:hypothetical protein B0T24DRAFT_684296 [Lasiosphaeria ovina]|uniref:Uncharacterized protein n=1 Tax=Lasiosphaeria ovina TaxID=92902 RepID=A0AAE0JUF0_9PEZI|nr:hypothetical protein B0T24DRAFT_684296 [Lasiosphaeria ovina]
MAYLEGDESVEALIPATQEAAVQIAQEDRSPALGRAGYNMHPRALAETVAWLASPGEASLQRLLIARDDAGETPFQVNPFQAPALSDTLPPMPLEDSDHLVRAAISVARPAGREVSEGVGKDDYESELEDHELDVNFDNDGYMVVPLSRFYHSTAQVTPTLEDGESFTDDQGWEDVYSDESPEEKGNPTPDNVPDQTEFSVFQMTSSDDQDWEDIYSDDSPEEKGNPPPESMPDQTEFSIFQMTSSDDDEAEDESSSSSSEGSISEEEWLQYTADLKMARAIALGRAPPSTDGMYPVTQQSTMYHYTSPRGEFYLRELRKYIDLPADYPITQMVLNLVSSWHKTRENVEYRHPSLAAAANSIDFTGIDKESGLLRVERQILEVWLVSRLPLVGWWGEAPQVKEITGRRFKQIRDPSPLSRVRYDFD